jgi:hypothetical protein
MMVKCGEGRQGLLRRISTDWPPRSLALAIGSALTTALLLIVPLGAAQALPARTPAAQPADETRPPPRSRHRRRAECASGPGPVPHATARRAGQLVHRPVSRCVLPWSDARRSRS